MDSGLDHLSSGRVKVDPPKVDLTKHKLACDSELGGHLKSYRAAWAAMLRLKSDGFRCCDIFRRGAHFHYHRPQSQTMSRPTYRLSNTELAMIQVMRKQPSYSDFDPNIDTAVPSKVTEAYRNDSPRYFAKLLAERAKLFCKEKLGVGEKSLQEQFLHAAGVAAVVLLVLSVIAFAAGLAIASSFFDVEKGTASVLAIFWLVALTALPIVFPMVSLLFLVIHRLQLRPKTGIATVVVKLFRTIRRIWCRIAMRLGLVEDADPNAVTSFEEVVVSHTYFGSAGAVFVSNIYFLVVALVIWGSAYFHLSTKRIDFFYQDSTSHIESRQTKIQYAAAPVYWLTGTQMPSEDAIAWAGGTWIPPKPATVKNKDANGSSNEGTLNDAEATESLAARMTQGFRVEWSSFLLAIVFTYVFFPRLIVALVTFGMTYYFRRDFVPKQSEKECRRIVDNILDPPIASETIIRNSDSDPERQGLTISVPDPVSEKELPDGVPSNVEQCLIATTQTKPLNSVRSTSRLCQIVAVGGNPDFSRIVSELALSDSRLANRSREFIANLELGSSTGIGSVSLRSSNPSRAPKIRVLYARSRSSARSCASLNLLYAQKLLNMSPHNKTGPAAMDIDRP